MEVKVLDKDGKIYVVRGATLSCNAGSMTSRIMIPECYGVYVADKAQLTVMDYKTGENISHFGYCTSEIPGDERPLGTDEKGKSVRLCSAKLIGPWQNSQSNMLIDGFLPLTSNCKNYCYYGGEITIIDHQQKKT